MSGISWSRHAKIVSLLGKCIFNRRSISKSYPLHGSKKTLRTYNIPHPPKDPPEDYQPPCVEHCAFEVPDFIPASVFRQFKCPEEILGPNAHKDGCYKNPEYFGYHRYSFVALQLCALKLREERIKNGGTNCIICEDEMESDCESDQKSDKATGTCDNSTDDKHKK